MEAVLMKSIGHISVRPWLVSTLALISLSAFGAGCSDKPLGDARPGDGGPTVDTGSAPDVGSTPDVGRTPDVGPTPDTGTNGCTTSSQSMVGGQPTGYSYCDDILHRPRQTTCPNLLPRAPLAHPTAANVVENCKSDADCTARPDGYCAYSSGFIGSSWSCAYGCLNDQDCGAGHVCQCGDPVGVCIATSNCITDADCAPGKLCAGGSGDPNETFGSCGFRLACQTPADKCQRRADCNSGGSSSEQFCAISSTGRKCEVAPQDSACF
jgi:hypothetical protein